MTEKEIEDALVKTLEPPDGGWGWVVVFASFLIHVIVDGITYSFGVIFRELLAEFQSGKGDTAWIVSIFVAMTLGTGPFACVLVNMYGCRAVTIAGAIVGSLGFILSPFAPSIQYLYFSFGFVAGLGFGLIYLPAIVVVSYYFERRRALATGLACCGSGLGTFIFSPLCTWLIEEYGWKQTCFWLAGIILQCCILGALFRPLPVVDNTEEIAIEEQKTESHPSVQLNGKSVSESHAVGSGRVRASTDKPHQNSQITSLSSLNKQDLHNITGHQLKEHITLHRKDVFYSGSLQNIPLYQQNRASYITSNMSLAQSLHHVRGISRQGTVQEEPQGFCTKITGSFSELIDFSLLSDFAFDVFLISNLFTNFGFNAPFLYIPDRAVDYGLSEDDAAMLLSAVGIANTVGRILFGFLADLKWIKAHRIHLYNTGLVIAGLATSFSYVESYTAQMIYAVVFGLFIGCYVSLTAIVLVDLLGVDKLSSSFGVTLLVQGVAVLIGPPACGWIYDATQNYLWPFAVTGGAIAFSGFMLYFLPLVSRCQHGTKRDEKDISMGVRIAVTDTDESKSEEKVALNQRGEKNPAV